MQGDLILATKKRIGQAILFSCFGVVVIWLGVVSIYQGFTMAEYMQLPQVLAGMFLCLMGLIFFYIVRRVVSYRLYDDRLEVISLFGDIKKTIWLSAITSWHEAEIKNRTTILTLYAGDDKCTISSSAVGTDYAILRDAVTKGKERGERQVNTTGAMLLVFIILMVGIYCLAYSYHLYHVTNTEVQVQNMTTIGGVIVNPVAISRTGGRSSRNYIRIILSSYPQFVFTIDYSAYRATKRRDYVAHVLRADSLYLDILTEDYQKKLTKEKPLTFFDKTVDYTKIDVYGLRDAQRTYLSVEGYNGAIKSDSRFIGPIIGGAFALFFAVIIIVSVNRKKVM